MATKKYYVRKFLNKKDGIALIEINGRLGGKYETGFEVLIGDCTRHITLDFYREDRLEKLDLLISELTKVRDWYTNNTINKND